MTLLKIVYKNVMDTYIFFTSSLCFLNTCLKTINFLSYFQFAHIREVSDPYIFNIQETFKSNK